MKKYSNIIMYIFVISIILSFVIIKYLGNKYSKEFIEYGVSVSKRVVTIIINNSISSNLIKDSYVDKLLNIEKDNDGNIENIDINTFKTTLFLDIINKKIEDNLNILNKGNLKDMDIDLKGISDIDYEIIRNGIVYYIPFGSLTGNSLLGNVGPLIPIKLLLIGDVISNIDSKIKEYGINNAMIEVDVDVKVEMLVSLLFVSRRVNIEVKRPIIMKIIQGNIPEYYLGGNSLYN